MPKNGSEDGESRKLPPGSVFIDIQLPGEKASLDLINFERQIEELDTSQRSERAQRMKWARHDLPAQATRLTSVGYPIGPWIIPYKQAKDCYVYGFYRAAIAMSGATAESMCLTLLHHVVGRETKYDDMTLGKLINEIKDNVSLSEQEILCRLRGINAIRNKWLHMKSNDFFADPRQVLHLEESIAKADAEKVLTLVYDTLRRMFEIRPAPVGKVRIHINAQRKQDNK
ncbi:MAG: hypothetical protein J7L19_06085 [Dehalococcoidia bacterium]|nr:hypothetical protein [Dehalococcoidia bacterium]